MFDLVATRMRWTLFRHRKLASLEVHLNRLYEDKAYLTEKMAVRCRFSAAAEWLRFHVSTRFFAAGPIRSKGGRPHFPTNAAARGAEGDWSCRSFAGNRGRESSQKASASWYWPTPILSTSGARSTRQSCRERPACTRRYRQLPGCCAAARRKERGEAWDSLTRREGDPSLARDSRPAPSCLDRTGPQRASRLL